MSNLERTLDMLQTLSHDELRIVRKQVRELRSNQQRVYQRRLTTDEKLGLSLEDIITFNRKIQISSVL